MAKVQIPEDLLDIVLGNDANIPDTAPDKATGVTTLPVDDLSPFPDHRFKPLEGEAFWAMVESIKTLGVLHPVIIWNKTGKYIILSGHNRVRAAKEAGIREIPVIIKENLKDEEATLIVTETNLRQRSFADLRHSERALCLSQHYEAMKKQGKRTDLIEEIKSLLDPSNPHETGADGTSRPMGEKLNAGESIGEEYGLAPRNVSRYIRISELNTNLLDLLDDGAVAFRAAVEISFIKDTELQDMIYRYVTDFDYRLDIQKAAALRGLYSDGKLDEESMLEIFTQSKNKQKPSPGIKLSPKLIGRYFPAGGSKKEIASRISDALDFYEKYGHGFGEQAVTFYNRYSDAINRLFPPNATDDEIAEILSGLDL